MHLQARREAVKIAKQDLKENGKRKTGKRFIS